MKLIKEAEIWELIGHLKSHSYKDICIIDKDLIAKVSELEIKVISLDNYEEVLKIELGAGPDLFIDKVIISPGPGLSKLEKWFSWAKEEEDKAFDEIDELENV